MTETESPAKRCATCDFLIRTDEPYVLTEFGYTHCLCAPEETP